MINWLRKMWLFYVVLPRVPQDWLDVPIITDDGILRGKDIDQYMHRWGTRKMVPFPGYHGPFN